MQVSILKTTLSELNINFNLEQNSEINLEISMEATFNLPKNENEKSALAILKVNVISTETKNSLVTATANVVFKLDEYPNDFEGLFKNYCIPLAQKDVCTRIDNILEISGYSEFKISPTDWKEIPEL